MSPTNLLIATGLLGLLAGCLNSSDSGVNELGSAQKPEGFLVVSDLVADTTNAGSFVVTCLGQNGKSIQEVKTKAEIQKNLICKPAEVVAPAAAGGPAASSSTQTTQASGSGFKISFTSKVAVESYLKVKSGISISTKPVSGSTSTGTTSTTTTAPVYQKGLDYCIVPKDFVADQVCAFSQKEYKAINAKIVGCVITTGYLFIEHFTVSPSTVPACK